MAESCSANAPLARKIHTTILQRLASVGQIQLATACGTSESTVSRWKSETLESCTSFLAALGLKVVPAAHKCYSPEHIAHLEYFARLGMQQQTPTLEWEDEQ